VRLGTYILRVAATITARPLPDPKQQDARLKAALAYLATGKRVGILRDAAGRVEEDAAVMDATPWLLNVSNGVVDLRTGELGAHSPAFHMTKIARSDFVPGARSQDWVKALRGLSDDLRDYLQVVLGLAASGESVADRIFVAVGSGGNGKSTILGAVHHVLGNYAIAVPAKLFTAEGSLQTQILMPLRGARLALAAESGEDHYLAMERLKALSGGDELTDRNLYSRHFAYWMPTHTLVLMTNHRPRVKSSDEGTWRRLQLVPFVSKYTSGGTRDMTLRDRLKDKAENREAVLAWVVAGAVRWFAERELPPCLDVDMASTLWRDDEDAVAVYFREAGWEVSGKTSDVVRSGELYNAYRLHTMENGAKAFSLRNWKMEMERYAERRRNAGGPTFISGDDKHGAYWRGLRKVDAVPLFKYPGWVPPVPEEDELAAEPEGEEFPW
jgi:putative DNA primase/helicase